MPYWKAFLLTPVVVAVAASIVALAIFLIESAIEFVASITPFTIDGVVICIVLLAFWAYVALLIRDTFSRA